MVLEKTGTKRMRVVIPYCKRDIMLCSDLLSWIKELGGCEEFDATLASPFVGFEVLQGMRQKACQCFRGVDVIVKTGAPQEEPWPLGANRLFEATIAKIHEPFLWLEPDAVPLKEGWLHRIASVYSVCEHSFMGSINEKDGVRHLSGVAVYPDDARNYYVKTLPSAEAFDMVGQEIILNDTYHTKLIYNFWGRHGLPPTFKETLENGDPENTLTLASIPKDAVLFHRSKDGTLLKLLREQRKVAA